jgi:hypothetical protein
MLPRETPWFWKEFIRHYIIWRHVFDQVRLLVNRPGTRVLPATPPLTGARLLKIIGENAILLRGRSTDGTSRTAPEDVSLPTMILYGIAATIRIRSLFPTPQAFLTFFRTVSPIYTSRV